MKIKHATAKELRDARAVGNVRYDITSLRRLRLVVDVVFDGGRTEPRVVFSAPWPKKKGKETP